MTTDEIIAHLQATNLEMSGFTKQQALGIERQRLEIAEFKERLNKYSYHSSKSPSSDGFANPAPKVYAKNSAKNLVRKNATPSMVHSARHDSPYSHSQA